MESETLENESKTFTEVNIKTEPGEEETTCSPIVEFVCVDIKEEKIEDYIEQASEDTTYTSFNIFERKKYTKTGKFANRERKGRNKNKKVREESVDEDEFKVDVNAIKQECVQLEDSLVIKPDIDIPRDTSNDLDKLTESVEDYEDYFNEEFKTATKELCDIFSRHTKKDERSGLFICELCSLGFKYKYDVRRHIKNKHDISTDLYRCLQCDFQTKYKHVLSKHSIIKHDSNAALFHCEQCDFKTKHKYALAKHFRIKHDQGSELFVCHVCVYTTKCSSELKKHFKLKHDNNADVFRCEHCAYETKRRGTYNKHMKVKQLSCGWFKCVHCNYKTQYKCALSYHFKNEHGKTGAVLQCRLCEFETKTKAILVEHFGEKHGECADSAKWEHCD